MKNTLILVVATAALLTAVNGTSANEPLLSPRAKANQIRVVPGSSVNDLNLANNRPVGNAKAWVHAQSLRTVSSTGPSVDLAHGPRPMLSPKDPRYGQVVLELRESKFQVAPLK
jgi:hypothetical protein